GTDAGIDVPLGRKVVGERETGRKRFERIFTFTSKGVDAGPYARGNKQAFLEEVFGCLHKGAVFPEINIAVEFKRLVGAQAREKIAPVTDLLNGDAATEFPVVYELVDIPAEFVLDFLRFDSACTVLFNPVFVLKLIDVVREDISAQDVVHITVLDLLGEVEAYCIRPLVDSGRRSHNVNIFRCRLLGRRKIESVDSRQADGCS